MSLVQIKEQLAQLPRAEQKELIGFLLALGRTERENREFREMLARNIGDKDPKNWFTLEQARKRYGTG